jgi:hypothetical protein
MKKVTVGFKNPLLNGILILLMALFVFSLFKNIQYPLLWNDESETAMHAGRVLQYGYPKVHDGKNIVNITGLPEGIDIDKKSDAYLGHVWGQYYFSAIGVFFARSINDIYIKTAVVRIPFALTGFIGLVIMGLIMFGFFKKDQAVGLLFLIFFVFFELLSTSLVLHLREAKYYSLVIFLSAALLYIYINYRFNKKINPAAYCFFSVVFLFLLFNTFPPVFFIYIFTVTFYELFDLLKRRQIKDFMVNLLPLITAFIACIPLLIFFKFLSPAKGDLAISLRLSFVEQSARIISLWHFFLKYEFLSLVLVVKAVSVILRLYLRKLGRLKCFDTQKFDGVWQKAQSSDFLSLFFLIYILVITKLPGSTIFVRYYITLQPVLVLILLLDAAVIFEILFNRDGHPFRIPAKAVIIFIISATFVIDGLGKMEPIQNHIYEIFHQYQGPLDFIIPYLKFHYKEPKDLVIATNYEEYSYMYYLGSKTIIGYDYINLEEDLKSQPDVIVFRKKYTEAADLFNLLLRKSRYRRVSFPCFDYPYNNISDLYVKFYPHLFKTKLAENNEQRVDIYIKF